MSHNDTMLVAGAVLFAIKFISFFHIKPRKAAHYLNPVWRMSDKFGDLDETGQKLNVIFYAGLALLAIYHFIIYPLWESYYK